MSDDRCTGCGHPAGDAGCRAEFEVLLARDFSDSAYFRLHRLMVDTYSLQHPDRHCVSAKSLAAHLTGLCWALEHGGATAVGDGDLGRWLDGPVELDKPPIPELRGERTIQTAMAAVGLEAYQAAVEGWARSTWEAYSALHPIARQWSTEAKGSRRRTRR